MCGVTCISHWNFLRANICSILSYSMLSWPWSPPIDALKLLQCDNGVSCSGRSFAYRAPRYGRRSHLVLPSFGVSVTDCSSSGATSRTDRQAVVRTAMFRFITSNFEDLSLCVIVMCYRWRSKESAGPMVIAAAAISAALSRAHVDVRRQLLCSSAIPNKRPSVNA